MSKSLLLKPLHIGLLLLAAVGALSFMAPGFWTKLFSTQGFMPHGHCYFWRPEVVWLHVSSDMLIGLSYVAISATLAYLVHKARGEIPFYWMILGFGLFIVACGGTHFMEVWTLWQPRYWLSGDIKLITAAASLTTAFSLPPLIPKVLAMIQDAKLSKERKQRLESANRELETLNARLKELDELTAITADRAIPGHGPTAVPWPVAAEPERRYLETLVRGTRAAIKAGTSIAGAASQVGQSERGRWLLFDEFHPRNVTASYKELEWE